MHSFWLRIRAPFAAFRWLQAGVYRASSPTIPPSAAWGLVMNLAGIETRDSAPALVTRRRSDAPRVQVAIGEVAPSELNTLYQQLHGYPVGSSGADLEKRAHGSKYWIAPVRREILCGVDVCVGVRDHETALLDRVRQGLAGELPRYGLPFLGDNNLLIDRIEVLEQPHPARWFRRVDDQTRSASNTARLTVDIDRQDSSRTKALLFQRSSNIGVQVPEDAWTWVPEPT